MSENVPTPEALRLAREVAEEINSHTMGGLFYDTELAATTAIIASALDAHASDADAARKAMRQRCADLVRQHHPQAPELTQ